MKALFLLFLVFASVIKCEDFDGDGFDTDPANGQYQDCCDTVLDGCFDPFMVNPGAYEIPNNGLNDRCVDNCNPALGLKCQILDEDNLPCDYNHISAETYILSGPTITSLDTEPAVYAMDICDFKDDDDDPSWGFVRQINMVFALANEKRWGFDIGYIGPDILQAAVIRSFGRIGPFNGEYMLAMSSGIAKAKFQTGLTNTDSPSGRPDYVATTDFVPVATYWSGATGDGIDPCTKPTNVWDSILARFSMVHPSNMGAFSIKVMFLDYEFQHETVPFADPQYCSDRNSWFLAFKNGTYGIPPDRNFAIDPNNYVFNSFNPNVNFFTQCAVYQGTWPDNTCYNSDVHLESSNFNYASPWIPIGTKAFPNEVFELQFLVFDQTDQHLDTTVLIDDFKVISEARETHLNPNYISVPYGYQYTADVSLVSLLPDVEGIYPPTTTTVTLSFIVRNEGPEVAGDITVSFTPPFGTSFNSITNFQNCTIALAKGNFVDNSFYKCKLLSNEPLPPHSIYTGAITYNLLNISPKNLQFRVTATTSSIDVVWGNNHLIQLIYINK